MLFCISQRIFLDYRVKRKINNFMAEILVMKYVNHRTQHHVYESKNETDMQQLLMP